MTPLWRKAYDAIERPLAAGSEAWIQSDTFMDLATHSIRIQRRMLKDVQHATDAGCTCGAGCRAATCCD